MYYSNTIFNQLLNFLPRQKFDQLTDEYQANRYAKSMTCWNQFVAMLYAQASGKKSLREVETGFNVQKNTWYHLGINSVARSTLAEANSRINPEIFEKLFYSLLDKCKEITCENKFDFSNPLYSLDSSTINLCLSVFDWAKYRTTKGALKLHMLLNNRTAIPELINITDGKSGDVTVARQIEVNRLEKGSIIAIDRGYIDYGWWNELDENGIYFVSRTKSNTNVFVTGQHNIDLAPGIIADEAVIFGSWDTLEKKYSKKLRRIKYYDKENEKLYTYLTNNFSLSARQIAGIYKERWQIELFFKWIKQNLKIKIFLGTSRNAVMTQIWIAMIYYLLLAYIKFQTKFKKSLLELTWMIKEVLLVRRDLIDLLSLNIKSVLRLKRENNPQMSFF